MAVKEKTCRQLKTLIKERLNTLETILPEINQPISRCLDLKK